MRDNVLNLFSLLLSPCCIQERLSLGMGRAAMAA